MTDRPIRRSGVRVAAAGLALGTLLATGAGAQHAQESQGPRPAITALAIDAPIVLDGVLDEEIWQRAEVGRDFTAREPNDHLPASEATEFSVLYTASTLYFGIRAFDSHPEYVQDGFSRL